MTPTVKQDGSITLICNLRPLRQVVGIAMGTSSAGLQNIGPNAALNLIMGEGTISLPATYCQGNPTEWYGPWPTVNGQLVVVYSYIAGWPHTTLGANVAQGATSITVNPPVPGATTLYGAYAGTALTIKDGGSTETVILASAPTGLTLNLVSGTQFAHTLPTAPDGINVTALPDDIEEATISMVNLLIKTQGSRAQVLPGSVGQASPQQLRALARAGALADMELACKLLHPYVTTFVH
jgi:hypothetical protein